MGAEVTIRLPSDSEDDSEDLPCTSISGHHDTEWEHSYSRRPKNDVKCEASQTMKPVLIETSSNTECCMKNFESLTDEALNDALVLNRNTYTQTILGKAKYYTGNNCY